MNASDLLALKALAEASCEPEQIAVAFRGWEPTLDELASELSAGTDRAFEWAGALLRQAREEISDGTFLFPAPRGPGLSIDVLRELVLEASAEDPARELLPGALTAERLACACADDTVDAVGLARSYSDALRSASYQILSRDPAAQARSLRSAQQPGCFVD